MKETIEKKTEAQGGGAPADLDFAMGGQAVLEGVMMRGPKAYAVAVRRPQGDIVMLSRPFVPIVKRKKWLGLPIVRGAVSLIEMLLLGYRALEYSANVADQGFREMEAAEKKAEAGEQDPADEPGKPEDPAADENLLGGWQMALIFMVSMCFAMLLFAALPNYTTMFLGKLRPSGELVEIHEPILYNLVSGAVRLCVIIAYIWAISRMRDIGRLFQYHGGEHKVVTAYEQKVPFDLDRLRPLTTLHPRCGTTFIAIVLFISIFFFAFLAAAIVWVYPGFSDWSIWARKPVIILIHIAFMPIVGGVAYEITRRAGRRPDFPLYRLLLAPGFLFQRLTTREPDDSMVEVALAAFREALEPSCLPDAEA